MFKSPVEVSLELRGCARSARVCVRFVVSSVGSGADATGLSILCGHAVSWLPMVARSWPSCEPWKALGNCAKSCGCDISSADNALAVAVEGLVLMSVRWHIITRQVRVGRVGSPRQV